MTPSDPQIERVVREVLADFGLLPGGNDAGPGPGAALPGATPKAEAQSPAVAEEFSVSQRVVALEHVRGRLESVRRLVVPIGAVVTPSVRDELRSKGVTLSFAQAEAVTAGRGVRLILVAAGRSFDPQSLVEGLQGLGVDVRARRAECLIRATDELAGELADGQARAVLTTGYPAAAVCLANRHRGVRAVQGCDGEKIAADAASIGANLLAIDPRVTGAFLLKQIVAQFCASGPVTCPSVFEERLG